MVSFNDIPSNVRTPRHLIEFDASRASLGNSIQAYTTLIIGQRLAAGSVAELIPTRISSVSAARDAFGPGSMLHNMAKTYFANNRSTETWFVAQDDVGGAVKATGTFTVAGTATEAGVAFVYVGGRRVSVPIANGDASTAVATAIDAALDLVENPLAVASTVSSVVTMTANQGGEMGNDIDLRINRNQGEVLPAGITIAVVAMASGITNPDINDVWPILGEVQYHAIAVGYDDQANLTAINLEMADRFGPERAIDGVVYVTSQGSQSTLSTLGGNNNSPHIVLMGTNAMPTVSWEVTGALAAVAALRLQEDPARPLQTLVLSDVLAPASTARFDFAEQELLLNDGIATFDVQDPVGAVRIQRAITTFQTDASGSPSTAFLDVQTLATLSFLRFDLARTFAIKYPRHKLANNGARFGSGQPILTPKIARGELLGIFRSWEDRGLVEGFEQFKSDLIVERASNDVNRLDIRLSPDLVNQARVFASQIQFVL